MSRASHEPVASAIDQVADRVAALRARTDARRAVIVGISGIDGAGKGYVAALVTERLAGKGIRAASVCVDPWLRPPSERFDPRRPAEHFYENGIRLTEFFDACIGPLKRTRSLDRDFLACDATNAEAQRPMRLTLWDVDVVIAEGIFLFKRGHIDQFDLRVWVECPFDTALRRAIERAQEGLPAGEMVRDYQTTYFPAQRLHMDRDDPMGACDLIIDNG